MLSFHKHLRRQLHLRDCPLMKKRSLFTVLFCPYAIWYENYPGGQFHTCFMIPFPGLMPNNFREEAFTSYRTNTYKLHVFETVSGYKFVMLGDPHGDSLRFVLRQIYIGPFLEYVVRNPLVIMDSRERGIDNEKFRTSVDRLIRGLTVFP